MPPASKTPTTAHSRPESLSLSPTAAFWKRSEAILPTMISFSPGRNMRPSTMWTLERSAADLGPIPRTTTFVVVPDLRGRFQTTTSSAVASGCPSGARAISGWLWKTAAASRVMMLVSSAVDPERTMIALSGEPVDRRADSKPPASASVKMKTQATSAMPSAVSAVLTRRWPRFRQL